MSVTERALRFLRGRTTAETIALAAILGLIAMGLIRQVMTRGERAMVAEMVYDSQSFALHQESYHRDSAVYSADPAAIQNRGFDKNPRIRFKIHEATSMGWAATISHDGTPLRCYVFVGDASPAGTASERGVVACD